MVYVPKFPSSSLTVHSSWKVVLPGRLENEATPDKVPSKTAEGAQMFDPVQASTLTSAALGAKFSGYRNSLFQRSLLRRTS